MKAKYFLIVMLPAMMATGCDPDYWDGDYVIDGYDSAEVVGYEGGIGAMGTEGDMSMGLLMTPLTPENAAQRSADRMRARFTPSSCLSTAVSGGTLTATFNKCTGPHGLVSVTGEVKFVYSINAGGILAKMTGTGVVINRYTMDVDTTIGRAITGNIATLTVTTKGAGNGPHGRSLTREGIYTLVYDVGADCRTIEGGWKTVVEGKTWNTSLSGHKRCGTDCPLDGATLVHEGGISGRSLTVKYDGTGTAKWESSSGKKGNFMPFCGGNI